MSVSEPGREVENKYIIYEGFAFVFDSQIKPWYRVISWNRNSALNGSPFLTSIPKP
jgi:hypothetical protein